MTTTTKDVSPATAPVIAAAATIAGLISSVRPVGLPCRPMKFLLLDDALISRPTLSPKGRSVLLVDATCASGDTMRLALSVMKEEGAKTVKSAVAFKTGEFQPDFFGLQSTNFIILPWDRDVIEDGEIVMRPDYEEALRQAGLLA